MLQEKRQQRQEELEAQGQASTGVSMGDFAEESSAFIVHHASILRNKRLLLVYTCAHLSEARPATRTSSTMAKAWKDFTMPA